MAKKFYTEKDIEDMCKGGILALEVHENIVLTELAYEKARVMGMKLVRDNPDHPLSAPVRPYLAQKQGAKPGERTPPAAVPALTVASPSVAAPAKSDLPQRIRDAVVARVGTQVDRGLLDVIIQRVLANTGVK